MEAMDSIREDFEKRFRQEIPSGWYIRNPETLEHSDIPEVIIGATDVWLIGSARPLGQEERYTFAIYRGNVTVPPDDFLDNYIPLEDPINYISQLEDSLIDATKTFRSMKNVRVRSGPTPF